MANVVEQRPEPHHGQSCEHLVLARRLPLASDLDGLARSFRDRTDHSVCLIDRPKRVLEAAVARGWVDEVPKTELADPSKTLERRAIENQYFAVAEVDHPPN